MKIIDADKLHYKQVYIATEKGTRPALVVFAKEIRKMPEIVRCKDCKFNYANQIPSENCCQLCVELPIGDEFYCAYGEREEDDKTDLRKGIDEAD